MEPSLTVREPTVSVAVPVGVRCGVRIPPVLIVTAPPMVPVPLNVPPLLTATAPDPVAEPAPLAAISVPPARVVPPE